jgi:hypothetical protein
MNPTTTLAQLFALRAMVDATIVLVQNDGMGAPEPEIDPAETCPSCGATGESQRNTSTLDGTQRRICLRCQKERTL